MKTKLALLAVLTSVFSFLAVKTEALPDMTLPPAPTVPAIAVLAAEAPSGEAPSSEPSAEASPPPTATPSPSPSPEPSPGPTPEADTPETEIVPTTIVSSSPIKNSSGLTVDTEALMTETPSLRLPAEGPQILLIHTHATEAYTMEPGAEYDSCGDWRSTDSEHNVIRVGQALKEALEAQGLSVIHDTGLYDYPSYSGSYNRCAEAVEAHLAANPGIAMVIDLHRDALGTEEKMYKTLAEGTDEPTAQLMFVVGTEEKLEHPLWQENLKLALYLQAAADKALPSLMRPVNLCSYRYNQQLSPGALILEVGTCGNTLEEALQAVDRFAEAAGPALLALAE